MGSKSVISKLINIGVNNNLNKKFTNKIKLNNRLALIFACLAIVYYFIFITFQLPILAYNTLLIGIIQLIVLPLNYLKLYNISRIYLSVFNAFICYFYSGLLGPESGVQILYIAAFFAPLVRFNFSEKWQLIVCYSFVLTFITLDIYLGIHSFAEPIFDFEQQKTISQYLFPITFLMMIFYGRAILKEQFALESKTLELEGKTEKQNQDLLENYRKLSENENDLQIIVSSLNDSLIIIDKELKITKYWGKNIHKELKSLSDYFSKENISIISHRINSEDNHPVNHDSIELNLQHGKYLKCSIHQVDIDRFVISTIDITEKKQIKQESDKRKKLLEDIISNLPTDIVLFDNQHKYLVVNEKAIKNDQTRKWIIGKDDFDYCKEFKKPKQIAIERRNKFDSVLELKEAIEWEEELIKDGNSTFILRRMSPIINDNKVDFVIGFAIDITKIKIAERKLVNAKNIAEENAKHKSQFLSTMSHEIRTPLNAIIGISHLLRDLTLDKKAQDYVDSMHFSAKNLLNLINDILDFTKIEAGKIKLERNPFNLINLLEQLKKQHEQYANDKGNLILLELSDNVPNFIKGDELRLSQILNNLLSNANKFTKNGTVSIKAYLTKDSTISFHIMDTGIGIKKENQQKIFDSFTQEYASTTRKYGGTGLGLAISKKLIELMGGTLKLTSEYKVGTDFNFCIPIEIIDAQIEPSQKPRVSVLPSNKQILIVEDNQLNAMIAEKFLNKWNIKKIDFAENGKIAVDLIKSKDYDLVLMDLQMPIMDGYTAAQEIRKGDLKTIIVALTAEALPDIRQKIFDSGMNSYVSKPFAPKDFFNVLSKYLN